MTMITLYTFGPGFGLPDPSPFVMKAEVLLKIAGLSYRVDSKGFSKAPKGKLPYIDDYGERIADSTFIRWHLEKMHKVDFDRGLSEEGRAVAWAFERTAEDHLYWALLDARWMNDANFDKGPRNFFQAAPAPIRPLIVTMVRRKVRQSLRAHGMGRHAPAEVAALATRSIDAMAAYLGQKAFFMGAEPVGVDATVFSFVAGALCPTFETPIRSATERHDNLKRYVGRMAARFYPDLREIAGCQTAA
jgi:glutathione S-transferase